MSWEDLLRSVKNFRYGRNLDRSNWESVWEERKGTCSSKHAFLVDIARRNGLKNIHLIMGMYKMSAANTPGIATVLEKYGLTYILEAHCYLETPEGMIDCTTVTSSYDRFRADVLEEIRIEPYQVVEWKVDEHKSRFSAWVAREHPTRKVEELWTIREEIIRALERER
ncbi:MAG: hypothetical protein A3D92_05230 [Bacteroidetes bacterium RIFCSPHIGHO2_02_FULL_44_7]|nr:MAG: hypothetical protein A3D92_05230 [Bacteroidetes bacterium RIFCSPHIGHO2_02_FULL_44_7]